MEKTNWFSQPLILSLLLSLITHMSVNAQLYVDSFGNTSIGDYLYEDGTLNVASSANTIKSYYLSTFSTTSHYCALGINNTTHVPSQGNTIQNYYGILLGCENNPNSNNYGISTCVSNEETFNTGRSYGLLSEAGHSSAGWNFGVCTSVTGTNNGTGLFSSDGSYPEGYNVQGRWAGFFDGNVKIEGNLTAASITNLSDYRFKENIRQLTDGSLNKLMDMNVVKYRLKNRQVDMGDTAKTVYYAYPEDSPILKKDHYGLIAQELREIYPELVEEGEDGYLSVNYIELIPILIKSIQELKAEVNALQNVAGKVTQRSYDATEIDGIDYQAILFQNDPNPFTENTVIKCVIPNSVRSALLYIYDMNGRQIEGIVIKERGDVSVTISGNSLDAGMYLYSLITDGVASDTKRMILTR